MPAPPGINSVMRFILQLTPQKDNNCILWNPALLNLSYLTYAGCPKSYTKSYSR